MDLDIAPSRRTVLVAGAGALTLAACSSSSGADSGATTATGNTGGTPGAGGTASTGDSSAASSGTPGALTRLDAVPVGQAVSVKLPDGSPGVVARPTATTAVAFSAICTHQGCTVQPSGATLNCPCHGSVYNALTGAVEKAAFGAPADSQSPLTKVPVSVVDGEVVPS